MTTLPRLRARRDAARARYCCLDANLPRNGVWDEAKYAAIVEINRAWAEWVRLDKAVVEAVIESWEAEGVGEVVSQDGTPRSRIES